MRVALIIPTIRPKAKAIVTQFIANATSHGIATKGLSVYFSIDLIGSTKCEDFYLDDDTKKKLHSVHYVDVYTRQTIAQTIVHHGLLDEEFLNQSFVQRGYAAARNAALFQALLDGNDFAINIDDDVVPVANFRDHDGTLGWLRINFFHIHLKALSEGADVTRGPYLGYPSPVVDLAAILPFHYRKRLGIALSLGCEILHPDILTCRSHLRYATTHDLHCSSHYFSDECMRKTTIVYGGNLGINLHSVREGKLPLFFNPPGARGEDSFFGRCLDAKVRVSSIPAYVFHDPFGLNPELLGGRTPLALLPIVPATNKNLKRFAEALTGWIKYAPLWIYTQHADQEKRNETLHALILLLTDTSALLKEQLNMASPVQLLKTYIERAQKDYDAMIRTNDAWQKMMKTCMA
jgi:hypothetical protein